MIELLFSMQSRWMKTPCKQLEYVCTEWCQSSESSRICVCNDARLINYWRCTFLIILLATLFSDSRKHLRTFDKCLANYNWCMGKIFDRFFSFADDKGFAKILSLTLILHESRRVNDWMNRRMQINAVTDGDSRACCLMNTRKNK